MLLPSSPSLLDHVANFSSWIPENINPLPVRSWPFPLGSFDRSEKTLADEALESFGVTTPLLRFHGVHSWCSSPSKDSHDVAEETYPDDEEDEELRRDSEPDDTANASALVELERTNGKPVLKYHPYVITRTQIRVVDETELFNRKAYIKAQKHLKGTACGKAIAGIQPNRYSCYRQYAVNGHWETLLKLDMRNETAGNVHTEWAYAPYIAVSRYPPGPKDLLQIPVNRENCTSIMNTTKANNTPSNVTPWQDFVNVTWKISYSGRTSGKFMMSQLLSGFGAEYDHNQTERDRILAQDGAEIFRECKCRIYCNS